MELQHAKLVAETERLNLRSEYDVKTEILSRENAFLQEERKKLKQEMKDMIQTCDQEFRSLKQGNDSLKNELLVAKREAGEKEASIEEIQNLKNLMSQTKSQLEKIFLENQSLQRQLQYARGGQSNMTFNMNNNLAEQQ